MEEREEIQLIPGDEGEEEEEREEEEEEEEGGARKRQRRARRATEKQRASVREREERGQEEREEQGGRDQREIKRRRYTSAACDSCRTFLSLSSSPFSTSPFSCSLRPFLALTFFLFHGVPPFYPLLSPLSPFQLFCPLLSIQPSLTKRLSIFWLPFLLFLLSFFFPSFFRPVFLGPLNPQSLTFPPSLSSYCCPST